MIQSLKNSNLCGHSFLRKFEKTQADAMMMRGNIDYDTASRLYNSW